MTDNINIIARSMWGYRVIQYGDAHSYALQAYRHATGSGGAYGWVTIESSRLRSYIFKQFHEFSLDAHPSTKV